MKRVKELKTPVQTRRRNALEKDTFPGRLDWKQQRFGVPVTSTPKPNKLSKAKGIYDSHNCFGFDESDDENNYSALMSPIPIVKSTARIPELAAALKKRKEAVKIVEEVQVLQENNSNSPPVPSINRVEVQPSRPEPELEKKKKSQPTTDLPDVETVEVNKPVSPVKKEKPKPVRKTRAKPPARRNQPTRTAKKLTCVPESVEAKELFEQDDLQSSQKLVEELSFDEQSQVPNEEEVYIKTGNPGDGFNAFLARYEKADDDSDEELHINVEKIFKTYSSNNSSKTKSHTPHISSKVVAPKTKKKTSSRKVSRKPSQVQDDSDDSSDDLDPALKKWLDEKNKEFDDVLHVPLVVAGSAPASRRSARTSKARRVKS